MSGKRSGKARTSRAPSVCDPKLAGFLDKLCDSWSRLPRPALRGLISKLREIIETLERVACNRAAEAKLEARLEEVKEELDADLDEADEGMEEAGAWKPSLRHAAGSLAGPLH